MRKEGALILCLALLCFCSCDRARIFEENKELQNQEWLLKTEPIFTFEIKDEKQAYDVFVNVRNNAAYPYQNLYVQHYLYGGDKKLINKALHNITLSDPKTGKPTGTGLADIRDHRVRFLRNVKFTRPGIYSVKLQHYMRTDALPGIMAIGLRVASAETE